MLSSQENHEKFRCLNYLLDPTSLGYSLLALPKSGLNTVLLLPFESYMNANAVQFLPTRGSA